jgi:signal transduction histidine kinase
LVNYINPAARTILNIGDGPVTPESSLQRVLENKGLYNFCQSGIESAEPMFSQPFTLRLGDEKRFLRISMIPLQREERRYGTLFLFTDETANIHRDQKLRETEKLAALTTMSAGMSHEIRNPLNSLSIHLQLLRRQLTKKGAMDEDTQKVFDLFSGEIQRLNDVIEMFLSAVRPSQPDFKLCDLYSVLTKTLNLLEPEFRQHHIQVILHEEGDWGYVKANEREIEQVFINIIKNAVEAIASQEDDERDEKDDEIVIRMVRDDSQITMVFQDSGKGIEEKELPHIFEPYFTNKPKGTGLGLMIVDRIIREHQGTIKARSQVGIGTQMIVTLPVAADEMPLLGESGKKKYEQR